MRFEVAHCNAFAHFQDASFMFLRNLLVVSFCVAGWAGLPGLATAQDVLPASVEDDQHRTAVIASVAVDGIAEKKTGDILVKASGLRVGQQVQVPGDPAFAVAIRAINRLGQYEQVSIAHDAEDEGKLLHLTISVSPYRTLEQLDLTGVNDKEAQRLKEEMALEIGRVIKPADINKAQKTATQWLKEKGYALATVEVVESHQDDKIDLTFNIEKGASLTVREINFVGNHALSDRALKRQLDTKDRRGWRFWQKNRFDESTFEKDKEKLLTYLHEKGFYDAQIVHDSVLVKEKNGKQGLHAVLTIDEGRPYFVQSISWEGNTKFTDSQLSDWLGIKTGDRYNLKKLEENLYGNARSTDVASQYLNLGYMRFDVQPSISVVGGDSLNLVFDIREGDAYTFGEIEIAGNYVTHDHVVRRELFSIPGERFSRAAIQESLRRLVQAGHFSEQSLSRGPGISVDDEKKLVNLRYEVEERTMPRPQITGSVGQFGLVLGLSMAYNNFSLQRAFKRKAWRPLPTGDGQQIGLNIQASGRSYQQYGLNFTEPWFRGKPAPLGFSISYTHIGADAVSSSLTGSFNTFSTSVFHDRRLKWPSPFFDIGTSLEFRSFNNTLYDELPTGKNQQLKLTQSITRNTTNHPVFPMQGSLNRLSVEVGVPLRNFVQYHKWRFQSSWNVPLTKNHRLSINAGADLGYIGSLDGSPVSFERFVLGGSPLDSQGLVSTPVLGTDVVYFRGYPLGAFSDEQSDVVGRRLLTKYSAELRWLALRQPQIQVMPYAFFDAANTWNSVNDFNPTSLFRSAGVGLRMNLPMLGLLEVVYGRNLDTYVAPEGSSKSGLPDWGLQFSIGRSFNF